MGLRQQRRAQRHRKRLQRHLCPRYLLYLQGRRWLRRAHRRRLDLRRRGDRRTRHRRSGDRHRLGRQHLHPEHAQRRRHDHGRDLPERPRHQLVDPVLAGQRRQRAADPGCRHRVQHDPSQRDRLSVAPRIQYPVRLPPGGHERHRHRVRLHLRLHHRGGVANHPCRRVLVLADGFQAWLGGQLRRDRLDRLRGDDHRLQLGLRRRHHAGRGEHHDHEPRIRDLG